MSSKLRLFVAVLIMAVSVNVASAQVPCIQVLYNEHFLAQVITTDCPSRQVELYVALFPVGAFVAGLEFSISYPPSVQWIGDTYTTLVVIGSSPTGVAMTWPLPLNGYSPVIVMQATVLTACDGTYPFESIDILPNTASGFRRLVTWPDYDTIDLSNTPAYINGFWGPPYHPPIPLGCDGVVPVKTATWGLIKSLYAE